MHPAESIALARQHLERAHQPRSARFCLAEAVDQLERGNKEAASMWAAKSLAYSVGVFSPDYQRVAGKTTL